MLYPSRLQVELFKVIHYTGRSTWSTALVPEVKLIGLNTELLSADRVYHFTKSVFPQTQVNGHPLGSRVH